MRQDDTAKDLTPRTRAALAVIANVKQRLSAYYGAVSVAEFNLRTAAGRGEPTDGMADRALVRILNENAAATHDVTTIISADEEGLERP